MFGDTRLMCLWQVSDQTRYCQCITVFYTLIFTKSYINKDTFISDIFLKGGVGREAVLLIFKSTHFIVYLL